MTALREMVQDCQQRGCRFLWSFSPQGDDDQRPYPHITVDHMQGAPSGTEVCLTCHFAADLDYWTQTRTWSDAVTAEVADWRDRVHQLSLDSIP